MREREREERERERKRDRAREVAELKKRRRSNLNAEDTSGAHGARRSDSSRRTHRSDHSVPSSSTWQTRQTSWTLRPKEPRCTRLASYTRGPGNADMPANTAMPGEALETERTRLSRRPYGARHATDAINGCTLHTCQPRHSFAALWPAHPLCSHRPAPTHRPKCACSPSWSTHTHGPSRTVLAIRPRCSRWSHGAELTRCPLRSGLSHDAGLSRRSRWPPLTRIPRGSRRSGCPHVLCRILGQLLYSQGLALERTVKRSHRAISASYVANGVVQLLVNAILLLQRVVGAALELGKLHFNQASLLYQVDPKRTHCWSAYKTTWRGVAIQRQTQQLHACQTSCIPYFRQRLQKGEPGGWEKNQKKDANLGRHRLWRG